MIKLDEKKLAELKTGSQHLAEQYGEKCCILRRHEPNLPLCRNLLTEG